MNLLNNYISLVLIEAVQLIFSHRKSANNHTWSLQIGEITCIQIINTHITSSGLTLVSMN